MTGINISRVEFKVNTSNVSDICRRCINISRVEFKDIKRVFSHDISEYKYIQSGI